MRSGGPKVRSQGQKHHTDRGSVIGQSPVFAQGGLGGGGCCGGCHQRRGQSGQASFLGRLGWTHLGFFLIPSGDPPKASQGSLAMRGAVASFATTWMLLGARITGMDADNWVWVVLAPMQKSPVLRQLTELMNMTPATAARPVAMRGCQLRSVVYILCVMALGMRGGMSGRMDPCRPDLPPSVTSSEGHLPPPCP